MEFRISLKHLFRTYWDRILGVSMITIGVALIPIAVWIMPSQNLYADSGTADLSVIMN